MRPIPFHKTLKMARERGFEKTVSIITAVLVQELIDLPLRLRYLPKKGAIVEVNNSKMLLFPKKGAVHKDLFLHKKREFICTDRLIRDSVIQKGEVVLDIGANIGYYVLIESQLVGAKGKVYAVEPVKVNIELLKKNLHLNNLKNVDTFQTAFGECNEESVIYVSNCANLSSMKRDSVGGKIIGIQTTSKETVDKFLKDKPLPSFIRMDVEGYEYEILSGMVQTLKGNLKILIEVHPYFLLEKLDDFFQILRQNGFWVRFAVFEGKAKENSIVNSLWQKGGVSSTTFVVENVSLRELQNLIKKHPALYPNVLFEKKLSTANFREAIAAQS